MLAHSAWALRCPGPLALHLHLLRHLAPRHDLAALRPAVEEGVLRVDRRLVEEDELAEGADGLLAVSEHVTVLVGPHVVHEVSRLLGHVRSTQHGAAHEQRVETVVFASDVVPGVLVGLCGALRQVHARPEHGAGALPREIDGERPPQDGNRRRRVRAVKQVGLVCGVGALARAAGGQPRAGYHGLREEELAFDARARLVKLRELLPALRKLVPELWMLASDALHGHEAVGQRLPVLPVARDLLLEGLVQNLLHVGKLLLAPCEELVAHRSV
mmetsp:Transcript_34306/g.90874  ORF Transcript_34306/g.90874 Transcript_34306/m.90874 type:complete len:272 (-) Transcript_34306:477-1292(-)